MDETQDSDVVLTDTGITRMGREEFLESGWDYNSGEHVTILGPTNSGKTYLAYQLLDATATPKLPAVVLVMKPRDATVDKWAKTVKFRKTRTWPPAPSIWRANERPRGWVLWPRFTMDPDRDDAELHRQFRRCLLDSYKRGNRIVFGDEAYSLSDELDLDKELVTLWTKGRSMDCGLWCASQKPTHIPLWAYSMAEHLFVHNDPDKRARQRYDEIGGVDPRLVESTVMGLKRHEFLYIRRRDGAMAVIEP
jgi:hypothetical protein